MKIWGLFTLISFIFQLTHVINTNAFSCYLISLLSINSDVNYINRILLSTSTLMNRNGGMIADMHKNEGYLCCFCHGIFFIFASVNLLIKPNAISIGYIKITSISNQNS